jgi:hypothetical protein
MITPGMNRQQRRAAARQKHRFAPACDAKRDIVPDAGLRLLNSARPYEPGEMAAEHVITTECFVRLRDGSGTEDDFDRISMILNVGLIRAETIDPSLVHTMQAGQEAMCRMKDRYLRGMRFGFDAQGLRDTMAALDDYQTIMDASTPLQMMAAIKEAFSRMMNGKVLNMNDLRLAA